MNATKTFALLILLCLLSIPSHIQAQQPDDLIDFNNPNLGYLEVLILEEVNTLRKRKRKPFLEADNMLQKAAQYHNNWMKETGKLSHKQPKRSMRSASDRVHHFDDSWTHIGENLQYIALSYTQRGRQQILEDMTYREAVKRAVKNWIKSKGHYQNLIDKDYHYAGTAVIYDKKRKRIHITQVYGDK